MSALALRELHIPLTVLRGRGAAEVARGRGLTLPSTLFDTHFDEAGFVAFLGDSEIWLVGPGSGGDPFTAGNRVRSYRRGDAVFAIDGPDCPRALAQICSQDPRQLTSNRLSMAATMGIDAWFWRHPHGAIWMGIEPSFSDYARQTLIAVVADCGGDIEPQLLN